MAANRVVIFYYTGTGNTLTVAQSLADAFRAGGCSCELHPVITSGDNRTGSSIPAEAELGLVFPVYGLNPPGAVRDFARALPDGNGRRAFVVANAHSNTGKTRGKMAAILSRKGWKVCGTLETFTPSGSIITEDTEDIETALHMHKEAARKTVGFAGDFLKGQTTVVPGNIKGKARMLSTLFGLAMPGAYLKKIEVNDSCKSCGTCAKVCPHGNISMVEGRPVWGKSCEVCLRCINACPTMAINAMGSSGRKRYLAAGFDPVTEEIIA